MKLIKENSVFLRAVANLNVSQTKAILKHADKLQLRSISEIAENVLAGNIATSQKDKMLLKKHRWSIRKIASARQTLKERQHIMVGKIRAVKSLLQVTLHRLI